MRKKKVLRADTLERGWTKKGTDSSLKRWLRQRKGQEMVQAGGGTGPRKLPAAGGGGGLLSEARAQTDFPGTLLPVVPVSSMSVAPGSVLVPMVTDTAVQQEPDVATVCFRWGLPVMRCAVCVNLHQASKTVQEKESKNLIQVFFTSITC